MGQKGQRKTKMTPERKQAFLEHLREHGLVILAAKHATPGAPLGARVSFYNERDRDPEFARAWEEAYQESEERLVAQLKRRGIDGYEEDVFGNLGNNQGTGKVGTKRVYSDKMAELFSRVQSLRIRNTLANKIELSGQVTHRNQLGLENLNPQQQELLARLLEAGDGDQTE